MTARDRCLAFCAATFPVGRVEAMNRPAERQLHFGGLGDDQQERARRANVDEVGLKRRGRTGHVSDYQLAVCSGRGARAGRSARLAQRDARQWDDDQRQTPLSNR